MTNWQIVADRLTYMLHFPILSFFMIYLSNVFGRGYSMSDDIETSMGLLRSPYP